MKVLVGPRCAHSPLVGVQRAIGALSEGGRDVVSLSEIGVEDLSRPITPAELDRLRRALGGDDRVMGYVCLGVALDADRRGELVLVEDHINLTWCSPLTGPNDDEWGPRFPSMSSVYFTGRPAGLLLEGPLSSDMMIRRGVVAGVFDDVRPSRFESQAARGQECVALSSELVPVIIAAAHMGLQVAAVAVTIE